MSQDMLDVTVHQAQGIITDLLQKLGGPNGHEWLAASKRFLRMQCVWGSAKDFPLWKTITLGRYKNANEYREALRKEGHEDSRNAGAELILDHKHFACAANEIEIDLVRLTCANLGLPDTADFFEICEEAEARGFRKCPLEVGPALRLVYKQRAGDLLFIANEDVNDFVDCPLFFYLSRPNNAQSRLVSGYAVPVTGSHFGKVMHFVFVRPRQ